METDFSQQIDLLAEQLIQPAVLKQPSGAKSGAGHSDGWIDWLMADYLVLRVVLDGRTLKDNQILEISFNRYFESLADAAFRSGADRPISAEVQAVCFAALAGIAKAMRLDLDEADPFDIRGLKCILAYAHGAGVKAVRQIESSCAANLRDCVAAHRVPQTVKTDS